MDEVKLTSLDANQLPKYLYNEDLRASRVEIVGSDSIHVNIDTKPLEEAIVRSLSLSQKQDSGSNLKTEIKEIKVPEIVKEIQIERIEVPVIVKEQEVKIVEIEKPIQVTKIEFIEKPVIVKEQEIKVVEVEKQVIIVQKEIKNLNYILILNTLAIIGLIAKLFIRG